TGMSGAAAGADGGPDAAVAVSGVPVRIAATPAAVSADLRASLMVAPRVEGRIRPGRLRPADGELLATPARSTPRGMTHSARRLVYGRREVRTLRRRRSAWRAAPGGARRRPDSASVTPLLVGTPLRD